MSWATMVSEPGSPLLGVGSAILFLFWLLTLTRVLTQNQHLAPSTQQAEQSWLNTRIGSKACQSIFLKLTKDEKQLDKTWNLPGGTTQFHIYG
jgi:hypothetical protein